MQKPIGILDLDSVMAGSIVYDYGDLMRSVRKGVDTTQIRNVQNAIHEGYMSIVGSIMTDKEIELLAIGEYCVSTELAIRYLTDYLSGDIYFKTVKSDDNIRCCRELINIVYNVL